MYEGVFLLAFHCFFSYLKLVTKIQVNLIGRPSPILIHWYKCFFRKWSKTMQASRDTRLTPLSAVPGSLLCLLQAFLHIKRAYPVPDHCPMFSYMDKDKRVTISQSQARLVLFNYLSALGLDAKAYRFPTFRRCGASLALSLNIPIQ